MSDNPIPVAVIGAGNMGANHIRVYDQLSEAELVEVVEPDEERAGDVSDQYDVAVLDHVADITDASAVTVAVPNHLHRDVAVECIEMGLDVLVEKPLATTVEDATAIADAAQDSDTVLQVGHIERFNPAVMALEEILESGEIIAIEAHRLGPFNEHLTTESVVFDLMIHDVDVIYNLIGSSIQYLDAVGSISRSKNIDHAITQFKFDSGVIGTATASHVTHGKVRRLDVTTRDAYVRLDYQQQDLRVQYRGREQMTTLQSKSGYRTETVAESPFVRTREPLKVELEHFLECVRTNRTPKVDGTAGVRAVKLADRIVDRITDRSGTGE